MRALRAIAILIFCGTSSLFAQEAPASDVVFAAALDGVLQELRGAPPVNLKYREDIVTLPAGAIVVARRTIGGAPSGLRTFVDKTFGKVIAEELIASYGPSGPPRRDIEQEKANRYPVLPLEEFESGDFDYDWARLNQKFPDARYVVRVSYPALDKLETFAIVRYELIGRDRPSTVKSDVPWQHATFASFARQNDGSWKRGISIIGSLWN